MKNNLSKDETESSFSIFHNNILSINRNLEVLETHIFGRIKFPLTVTEIKIKNSNPAAICPTIQGYKRSHVPIWPQEALECLSTIQLINDFQKELLMKLSKHYGWKFIIIRRKMSLLVSFIDSAIPQNVFKANLKKP